MGDQSTGDQSRGDRIRASDDERGRVAAWLAVAFEEGRLDLAEYDRRVTVAHAAVTRGDLAPLIDDLPTPPDELTVTPPDRSEPAGPVPPEEPPRPGQPAGPAQKAGPQPEHLPLDPRIPGRQGPDHRWPDEHWPDEHWPAGHGPARQDPDRQHLDHDPDRRHGRQRRQHPMWSAEPSGRATPRDRAGVVPAAFLLIIFAVCSARLGTVGPMVLFVAVVAVVGLLSLLTRGPRGRRPRGRGRPWD